MDSPVSLHRASSHLSDTARSFPLGAGSDFGLLLYCAVSESLYLMVSPGSDGKASAYSVGDLGSIPGLGISSEEGNGNPLQYSCLENPMDGGAW